MEPELGQSDGSGSSQIPRLRAATAPKPCCYLHTVICAIISRGNIFLQSLANFESIFMQQHKSHIFPCRIFYLWMVLLLPNCNNLGPPPKLLNRWVGPVYSTTHSCLAAPLLLKHILAYTPCQLFHHFQAGQALIQIKDTLIFCYKCNKIICFFLEHCINTHIQGKTFLKYIGLGRFLKLKQNQKIISQFLDDCRTIQFFAIR